MLDECSTSSPSADARASRVRHTSTSDPQLRGTGDVATLAVEARGQGEDAAHALAVACWSPISRRRAPRSWPRATPRAELAEL